MFDKSASLEKALRCIDEAAAHHPNLIVFPELFIPGYPVGMNFGFSIGRRSEEGRKDWKRYYDASAVAGEAEFQRLAEAARNTGAYISIGFSERDAVNGTLYNSNAIFEPDGSCKVHRKLKPTGSERVVWGGCRQGVLPRHLNAVGADRQLDLLGKLHAARSRGSVPKGHHDIHLAQHQRQPGVAGHHSAHSDRGQVLLR